MSSVITAFVITVVSTVYSFVQARKAARKAAREAEKRKGFEAPVEGEIGSIPIVYGRNKVAGFRVFHDVKSSYNFAASGDSQFLTSGDLRVIGNMDSTVTAVSGLTVVLSPDPENPGEYFAEPPSGIWTALNTEEVVVNYLGGATRHINRLTNASDDLGRSDFLTVVPSGQEAVFLPGATLTVSHPPWNHRLFNVYYGPDGEELPGTGQISDPVTHSYTIKSYEGTTLVLHGLYNSSGIYYPETGNTYGRIDNSGEKSLNENESGDRKREFFFVQQAICFRGIHEVYYASINELDYRDISYGESGRIHVYRQNDETGIQHDPLMSANFPDRVRAKFPDTAYASMAFKLDRDDPQYSGVPDVAFEVEGMRVKGLSKVGDTVSIDNTRVYSNNPALVLLDYLMSSEYGMGLSADILDLKSFHRVMLLCDTPVEVNGQEYFITESRLWIQKAQQEDGLTERRKTLKRFEFNGMIDTSSSVRSGVQAILATMASKATLLWTGGQYKLKMHYPSVYDDAEDYVPGDVVQYTNANGKIDLFKCIVSATGEPPVEDNSLNETYWLDGVTSIVAGPTGYDEDLAVAYITDDDIKLGSDISQNWIPLSDRFNYCTVTFPNEEKGFDSDTVSWPEKYSEEPSDTVYAQYLAEDNDLQLETTESVDALTTIHHAKAHAEEVVRSSRHERILKVTVSRKFFYLEPQDLVNIESQVLEIPGVLFLIVSVKADDSGSLDLVLQTFNAETLAWNAPDNEVVDPYNPYIRYPVGQASQLQFVENETLSGDLLRSGTLSWQPAGGTRLSYDVRYLAKPANAISIGEEWNHLGSTRELNFSVPILPPGTITFTVIARDDFGNIAPEFDMATGQGWPKLQHEMGSSSLLENNILVRVYRYTRLDIGGSDPSLADIWEDGTYDFKTNQLTPPSNGSGLNEGWYLTPEIAFSTAEAFYEIEEGEGAHPGNLYFIEALIETMYPVTMAEEIEWSNVSLVDQGESSRSLEAYKIKAAGEAAPTFPTGGSFIFGEGTFTPPVGWLATEPTPGPGEITYRSKATATRLGEYGPNTNTLNWTLPVPLVENFVTADVRLFIWSPIAPSAIPIIDDAPNPNFALTDVTSLYTWHPTRNHGSLDASGAGRDWDGWSLTLGPKPSGDINLRSYEARMSLQVSSNTIETVLDWEALATAGQVVIQGSTEGIQRATVYIYRWAIGPLAPERPLPSEVTAYGWEAGAVEPVEVPFPWTAQPTAYPGAGMTLWRLGGEIIEAAGVLQTDVNWQQTNFSMEMIAALATSPPLSSFVFRRLAASPVPARPTGGDYKDPVPDDWSDGIPSGTLPVWMSKRIFTVDGNAPQESEWSTPTVFAVDGSDIQFQFASGEDTPNVNAPGAPWYEDAIEASVWMRKRDIVGGVAQPWEGPIRLKGEVGEPGIGADGEPGSSSVIAYKVAPLGTGPQSTPSNITRTGQGLPFNNSWNFATSNPWSSTPPTSVPADNRLWVSNGVFDPTVGSTGQTTWRRPYWASLEVGSLAAVSVDTGSLNVTGDLTMGDAGFIKSGKQSFADNTNPGYVLGAGDNPQFRIGTASGVANAAGITFDPTANVPLRVFGRVSSHNYSHANAEGWLLANEDGVGGEAGTDLGTAYLNRLWIRTPRDGAVAPKTIAAFNVEGVTEGLDGAYIKNLSVDTLKIAGQAVTVVDAANTVVYMTHIPARNESSTREIPLLALPYSIEVPPGGAKIFITYGAMVNPDPDNGSRNRKVNLILKRGTTELTRAQIGIKNSGLSLGSVAKIDIPNNTSSNITYSHTFNVKINCVQHAPLPMVSVQPYIHIMGVKR